MSQKDICCHQLFHQEDIWSDGLIPLMNLLLHELIPPMDFLLAELLACQLFQNNFFVVKIFFDIEFFEKGKRSRHQKKKDSIVVM